MTEEKIDTPDPIAANVEHLLKAIAQSNLPVPVAAILAAILRAATEAATDIIPWPGVAQLRRVLQLRPEDDR